jgi:hypothetical protein
MLGRQHPSVDDNKLRFNRNRNRSRSRSRRRLGNDFGGSKREPSEAQQGTCLEEVSAPHHRGFQISFFHDSKLHDSQVALENFN